MELRYNARFRNIDNDLHEIRIFKDVSNTSGVTTTNIDTTRGNPSLNYKLREQFFASTLRFSFVTTDTSEFDELLTANSRDFRADYYIGGVLKWTGYLVPDDISRPYHGHQYTYTLKFSDGLGDLKNFEPDLATSGRQTLLKFIKDCLTFTDLELDFAIIQNLTEASSATTTPPLSKADVMNQRWINQKDGRPQTDNAQKIVSEILKPFNLFICQFENRWWIIDSKEVSSTIHYHNWSDLVRSSTATNSDTTNLQNYNFDINSNYTKERPIKIAGTTFLNKNLKTNLISNGDFSANNTNFWQITSSDAETTDLIVDSGSMLMTSEDTIDSDSDKTRIESDDFTITKFADDDIVEVSFRYKLDDITGVSDAGDYPYVQCELEYGSLIQKRLFRANFQTGWQTFTTTFSVIDTGTYRLAIYDEAQTGHNYTYLEVRYDDFDVRALSSDAAQSPTTYDTYNEKTNTGLNEGDKHEDEIMIGDGITTNDVGNLQIFGTKTESWSNYNGSESIKLQELYVLNKLKQNNKYKNKIRLTVFEENFAFWGPHRHFLVDSVRYVPINFSVQFDSKHNIYALELIEHVDATITTTDSTFVTDNVNGESTGSSSSTTANSVDTLQSVTERGKITDQGIEINADDGLIIRQSSETNECKIEIDNNGNVIFTADTEKNFHFSGDVVAFSDLTPPPGSWWDSMPIASDTVLGGVKIDTSTLSIDSSGKISVIGGAGTSGTGAVGTLQQVTDKGASTDQAITINNELNVDKSSSSTNTTIPSLYVKSTSTGTVANGFGSAIYFQYPRSASGENVGTYLESFLESGAGTLDDTHGFRIRVRDNDTIRTSMTVKAVSDVVFGRDIEARQFKSNFSGNDTIISSAQSTISSENRYGNIAVQGDFQNGYHGIQFADVKHDLMIHSDDKFVGFHHAGEGWSFLIGTGKTSSDATYMRTRRHFDGTDNFLMDWRDGWLRLGMYFNGSSWVTSGVGSADGIYLNAMDSAGDGGIGGRVAIRSAQQNKALDVNGRIDLNGYSSPGVWYRNGDTDWFVGPENSPSTSFRWYNGSNLMTLTNTGNLTTSGEMTAFSDRRLKRNIETYELDLEKFEKLRAVSYTRNRETKTGFIAQEVQELFPEFVNEQNDHMKTLSLNYAQMIALATSAIQETRKETQKEIDNLKKANERLRKRILKLEKK